MREQIEVNDQHLGWQHVIWQVSQVFFSIRISRRTTESRKGSWSCRRLRNTWRASLRNHLGLVVVLVCLLLGFYFGISFTSIRPVAKCFLHLGQINPFWTTVGFCCLSTKQLRMAVALMGKDNETTAFSAMSNLLCCFRWHHQSVLWKGRQVNP